MSDGKSISGCCTLQSLHVQTRNRHICYTNCSRCVVLQILLGCAFRDRRRNKRKRRCSLNQAEILKRLHAREVNLKRMPFLAKEQVNTTTVLHKGFTSISGERAVDFEMFQFAAPQHRQGCPINSTAGCHLFNAGTACTWNRCHTPSAFRRAVLLDYAFCVTKSRA